MYSRELIDDVLHHADIVQIISSYIPVIKKGRSYVALCPFHDDKNPSMNISPDKQIFKCFVCGAGGNAISFVQKHEKISFAEAVRKVASLAGYNDPRLVEQAPRVQVDPTKQKLFACINDLKEYYRYALSIPEGEGAREYLLSRDLGPEIQAKYQIGYAPKDGNNTVKYLLAKGYSLKNIEDIGIAFTREESNTADSNAGRVMFPLWDESGRVVGFSARRIVDDGKPKYVNTGDTPLFEKRHVLYNYHNAATNSRREGYCYLVEGFMDVMALDRAGIANAIALMGTQLTPEHITMIKRMRCELRLCLDGDGPGQGAIMKIIPELQNAGIPVRVVDYGGDLRDPDEILRQDGAEALKAKLDNLLAPIDFQLQYYLRSKKLETAEEKEQALQFFLPYLRSKKPGIEFEDALVKIAEATGYSVEAIRAVAGKQASGADAVDGLALTSPRLQQRVIRRNVSRLETAERTLLHYMLLHKEAVEYFQTNVGRFRSAPVLTTVAEFLIEFGQGKEGEIDLGELIAYVDTSGIEGAEDIGATITDVALTESHLPPYGRSALDDCAKIIAEESERLASLTAAQSAVDGGSVEDGARANSDLAKRIRERWTKRSKKG